MKRRVGTENPTRPTKHETKKKIAFTIFNVTIVFPYSHAQLFIHINAQFQQRKITLKMPISCDEQIGANFTRCSQLF